MVHLLLPIYQNQSNTIFAWQRKRPDLNQTITDNTDVLSCHIPYTHNILHRVSSLYFQSYKKLFKAGKSNVNIKEKGSNLTQCDDKSPYTYIVLNIPKKQRDNTNHLNKALPCK